LQQARSFVTQKGERRERINGNNIVLPVLPLPIAALCVLRAMRSERGIHGKANVTRR
jgi:hypothetical protein